MVQLREYDGGLAAGKRLATVSVEDEVVISGLAGVYPDSENVNDFANKLFNKVDLISDDDRRWKLDHPEIPQRTGKLFELNKFDASFFSLHYNQAQSMDPMCRLLLERTYEAVIDSGTNPTELKGSNTGVFIGACFSESEKTWFYEKLQAQGFGATGCVRSMMANRISYWLGINGPSFAVDTACSSGMYAFEQGYKAIRTGQCNSAIVAACNLCLHPYVSLQFSRLGVLSMDGKCKVFDETANGYCRSEAACVIFLQRRSEARRIYASIIHAKTNCDGYKEEGITYPSGQAQEELLIDFYKECGINPASLAWLEAHGTGTLVGDPEEVHAIMNVLCKGRDTPLKVGSVKSNIGHTEPVSGLCSITKVIIAMETGLIPPNINFNNPRKDIEALITHAVEIVTEPTPWEGGLVGVNSFGFGGANCHTVLKWNEKDKIDGGIPQDNIPRLVNVSGRTYDAVNTMLSNLEGMNLDREYIKLYHEIHKNEIPAHFYRGYVILNKDGPVKCKDIKKQWGEQPVVLHLQGLFSDIEPLDSSLLELPFISSLLDELSSYVKIDLIRLMRGQSQDTDSLIVIFLKITTFQICLIKLLKTLGISITKILGSSLGQVGCAYADGVINEKEAILISYFMALGIVESKQPHGCVINISTDVKNLGNVHDSLAVHSYGKKNCLVSGPKELVLKLMNVLTTEGISVAVMKTSNVALHSRSLKEAHSKISLHLQKVMSDARSSSSIWLNNKNKKTVSYEYFSSLVCNDLENSLSEIPKDAVIIDLCPPCNSVHNNLTLNGIHLLEKRDQKFTQMNALLDNLGRLYMEGVSMDLGKLYPPVKFPVSRSTPMISPMIKWDHSEEWYVPSYRAQKIIKAGERIVNISLKEEETEFIAGHIIDGRTLYPATGYLLLVWETVSMLLGETFFEVPIVFENVKFHRATNLTKDGLIEFIIVVQKVSGKFEVIEGGTAIVTGYTHVPDDIKSEMIETEDKKEPTEFLLSSDDIYKELRLRGYQYKGLFRSLTKLNMDESCGKITWRNNWVTFMDNMLQMKMLFEETRGLFVPTAIEKLAIDPKTHLSLGNQLPADDKDMLIHYYEYLDMVKCGGIEIRGMKANAISRRKHLGEPVLEKNVFVPYHEINEVYNLPEIVRIMVQTILENDQNISFKVVEYSSYPIHLLAPIIAQVLSDLPLIQPDITVISNASNPHLVDLPSEITVEDKKLPSSKAALIAVASNIMKEGRSEVLQNCLSVLKDNGFIITIEDIGTTLEIDGCITLASYVFDNKSFILLRKAALREVANDAVVKFDSENFSWIPEAKQTVSSQDLSRIIFYSEKSKQSGIIGFVNCLLKEGDGKKARCLFVMDEKAPDFSISKPFFRNQLSLDLAINVFKNGAWGSYRHLLIESGKLPKSKNVYVNFATRGDLSSLTWFLGNIGKKEENEGTLVYAEYSSLNFRDIMLATNKIAPEVVSSGRLEQECVIGFEFSGYTKDRTRVMGFASTKSLATQIVARPNFTWEIPDSMTLEEAATIPVVYATVLYSFIMFGKIRKGDSVLIHAGSGGVGQAAINVALHLGCRIFTTVGTPEKKLFIRQTFPQIAEEDIGNSRDTSFERMVMKQTEGRGVDIVLNSLADDKLYASIRCLAKGGRFLEIGKFDLTNNSPLGMELCHKGASFHGIMLDNLWSAPSAVIKTLKNIMTKYLSEGILKPIRRTVFNRNQLEQAFRFMASGKHIGKVLIKVTDYPVDQIMDENSLYEGKPKFYCNMEKTYIVIGGLGGFGLELADWLVLRGCRKLVLTSRKGITEGYQSLRIRIWESYGAIVKIATDDITTEEGVTNLLTNASSLGPVGGIFNLAVVLKDALFEDMTEESFTISAGPKAVATAFLDKISRKLCPELDNFVIFSSVACGRGNIGQTNYGMSNSIMERIIELRKEDNLPALAIQWGAVGDVGLVAKMNDQHVEIVIGGTLQQPITNCLQVMDTFMCQNDAIVASMVVAEKKSCSSSNNIVETVVYILGLTDLKNVSQHSTLAEIGMDSMMAVEIKQTLEREFEVFLSPQDVRSMTFAKLNEISLAREKGESADSVRIDSATQKFDIDLLLNLIGDEPKIFEPCIKLESSITANTHSPYKTFFIPGVEGVTAVMEKLAKGIYSEVYGLQFDYRRSIEKVEDIAEELLPVVMSKLEGKSFNLVGYSFGGLVTIALTQLLESAGYKGKVVLIDSSPILMKEIGERVVGKDDDVLQKKVLLRGTELFVPQKKSVLEKELENHSTWEARIECAVALNTGEEVPHTPSYQRAMIHALYKRIKATLSYTGTPENTLGSLFTLVKPLMPTLPIDDDYGLSKFCKCDVEVYTVEGTHLTILNNPKVAEFINKIMCYEVQTPSKLQEVCVPPNMYHVKDIK